jgi:hypothetical protein
MDFISVKKVLETKGIKTAAGECETWLLEHGYIYNPVFGWEKIDLLKSFALDPNMKGIPCVLKPKWVEKETDSFTDKYGNRVKTEKKTEYVQHPDLKEWYPSDNWLAYYDYKCRKEKEEMAKSFIPLPAEN